ncbi:FGGY-family carbohydrate kinase [Roseibium sediminis]|uniref:FGGY-family carbohydrate kinase n=1 Tax=Roseibium sediminis TaxID=1775174 RepID=UPI00123D9A35|nr:FGGY-family carbohydrate kinase [Roseibium sediminis]
MSGKDLFVGIDVGTSGVRTAAIDGNRQIVALTKAPMDGQSDARRDPHQWQQALATSLKQLIGLIDPARIAAISVDGTSGTVLALDRNAEPVGTGLMYNDVVDDKTILASIAAAAPRESAAHGASSALARAIMLQQRSGTARILHQADWIGELLSDKPALTDESNALKTGYDPVARRWPEWMAQTPVRRSELPDVVPTGTTTATTSGTFGLPSGIPLVAGVSDGCASFLATGADEVGDGVSSLGTTLTIKLLSDRPIFAPEYGIYSHRIGNMWLAGGASNSGGGALLNHFTPEEMHALSQRIDPAKPCDLDYYPLPRPGERFPINDPALPPRETPRPADDAEFLHGLLLGIAGVEHLGYSRLAELGAPKLKSIRTVGGGADNPVWTVLRNKLLHVPVREILASEAAVGSATIALNALL